MQPPTEPAIGARYHILPPDDVGEGFDALRDQLGMLDDIGGVADHTRNDEFAGRQLDVFPHRPFVLVTHVAGLETVCLRAHFKHQIDDLLERQVVRMRAVPGAPAEMVAHAILRNAGKRVIERVDADFHTPPIFGDARLRLDHIPCIRQTRIVDLQDEAGIDHRAVLIAQRVRYREHEFFLSRVVFVEDVMIEPACREHADERLLGAVGSLERVAENLDLAFDGVGRAALDGTVHHHLGRGKEPRLFSGHAEHRAGAVHGGVEPRESVTFAGLLPRRGEFAGPQRPRRHAGELLPVIREVPVVPEFAVTDATDADLHLFADNLGHL